MALIANQSGNMSRAMRAVSSIRFSSSAAALKDAASKSATKSPPTRASRKESKAPRESDSFVTNMFLGRAFTKYVFPFPNSLTQEQRETLEIGIESQGKFFKDKVNSDKMDAEGKLDMNLLKELRDFGAYGSAVPTEYGGLGMSATQMARAAELIGATDLSLSVTLGAHQSIGYKAVVLSGTEAQKKKYLPALVHGDLIAAFCLTEASNGSDAATIKTRAVKTADGKFFVLNGSKIWITNGGIADRFTVFAQTPMKDEKTGETKDKMTCLFVEKGFGGITVGPPEKKLGIKASVTSEVHFENCRVPVENVVGGEGNGFKVAMHVLNQGRFGMIAALSAVQRQLIERAVEHATSRTQFGQKIENYGTIQEKIARLAIRQYITESLAYMVSGIQDLGAQEFHLESAIGKVYSSEAAWTCADETIQIFGGMGYIRGTGIERILRDVRIFRIFEGINEVLRLFIAGTGLQFAGSHLKVLAKKLNNPLANPGAVLGIAANQVTRMVGGGNREMLLPFVHPLLQQEAIQTSQLIDHFGNAVQNILRKYGNKIQDEQMVIQRVADAVMELFSGVVVLSRATKSLNSNSPTADHELKLVKLICQEGREKILSSLNEAQSAERAKQFATLSELSRAVCANGGVVAQRVLGF